MNPTLSSLDFVESDPTWSFTESKPSQTRYITHGYHTYPAKFIPQLAARLITELSCEGDIVCDPFMGSGTTVVEALVHGRRGVGVDINPVAHLIARAKTTPIEPSRLERACREIENNLAENKPTQLRLLQSRPDWILPNNERIDYWFPPQQKQKLGVILTRINNVSDEDIRNFFLVAFSQILKSCSIWLQRSVKPVRDFNKVLVEPIDAFKKQVRGMLKRKAEFFKLVGHERVEHLDYWRIVACRDARSLPLESNSTTLIATSPPYVTSYEYADLYQLTALWLNYCASVAEFRRGFIGSAHSQRETIDLGSETANAICRQLGNGQKGREVRNYFADMFECFQEMWRVLKPTGKACIVIGNTELQGVKILNAEVFVEQMQSIGFHAHRIIKREIPSKMLPQTRDAQSGRFASVSNGNNVHAYPTEYILIMEK